MTDPAKESPDKISEAIKTLARNIASICCKLYTKDENNRVYRIAQNAYDRLLRMITENHSPDAAGMKKVSDALNELSMICERQKSKNVLISDLLVDDIKHACLHAEKVMALMQKKSFWVNR